MQSRKEKEKKKKRNQRRFANFCNKNGKNYEWGWILQTFSPREMTKMIRTDEEKKIQWQKFNKRKMQFQPFFYRCIINFLTRRRKKIPSMSSQKRFFFFFSPFFCLWYKNIFGVASAVVKIRLGRVGASNSLSFVSSSYLCCVGVCF